MKKSIFMAAAFAAVTLISCKKTETVATDVNADSTATAVVVDNDSLPIISDSTAVGEAINATGDAVEKGAAEVKDAAKDATDGDGDITK
ncbi:hypothetical protein [Kaistella faecalis]|uniref:hypothetical protein n=1 Tax=Kaistella faecalis TaxID=2852098 RepID=UPI001A2C1DE1|nr:hypothetical protein [Chryseobacterium faecale]MBH1958686.1 hypothetical protein [Flavobacteriia bacterium]MBH2023232.1 hypothetical protein [Flavobacteriales bacterium]MBP3839830.1 hypothetical protein [Chryseobacterium sp.]UFK96794.1 hypothetical protein LL667_07370 [Chryseobacterium faecale]